VKEIITIFEARDDHNITRGLDCEDIENCQAANIALMQMMEKPLNVILIPHANLFPQLILPDQIYQIKS
jgi:hypothetical protein